VICCNFGKTETLDYLVNLTGRSGNWWPVNIYTFNDKALVSHSNWWPR
jgi:hypothetical protein